MQYLTKVYIDYSQLDKYTVDELKRLGFEEYQHAIFLGVTGMHDGIVLVNANGNVHEIPYDNGFGIYE